MAEQVFSGSLKPGVKLGKYEIREKLGAGGMAVIYRAYDPTLDRCVAIKQIAAHLAQDERFLERFRTEAQTLAKLSTTQANIVSVYELIQQDGQLFLVMECVEGTTLRAMMDRGPVPLQTALGVLLSTALGLKAMHSMGIVHRDLTPANIMMAKDGALKITDFGLIGHSGGKTSLPMGTTKYMAPEMFTGVPVDPRADLYSLGMIAYEMLVGPDKFAIAFKDVLRDEKAQQVRWMHWHSNPTLKAPPLKDMQPGIPPLVTKIVDRMMEKDPSKRFASSEQIIKWLRRIFVMHVQGKSVSVTDSEAIEKEIEADTLGVTPAPSTAARPSAGAAGRPAAGAAVPEGEKTAPLPVVKWTWKRAAILAALILGPILAASIGLLVWKQSELKERLKVATQDVTIADQQFENKDWKAAKDSYVRIANTYPDLPAVRAHAAQRQQMAAAEEALEKKEWDRADKAAKAAEETFGAPPAWVTGFRTRLTRSQDIEQRIKEADALANAGKDQEAIDVLLQLQKQYPEVDLNDRIAPLREKITLKLYNTHIRDAEGYIARNDWVRARESIDKARSVRGDTPRTTELAAMIATEVKYAAVIVQADKAATDGKWADAARQYEEANKLKSSQGVLDKLKRAKVEDLLAKARLLVTNNMLKEATDLYIQIKTLEPTNPEAAAFLNRADRQKQRDDMIAAFRKLVAEQKYDELVNLAPQALALLEPTDDAIKNEINTAVTEAKYKKAMDKADAELAQDKFDEATQAAAEAQGVKDTDEVKAFAARVERRKGYAQHLKLGKELLDQGKYVEAIKEFEAAKKFDATPEADTLIAEAQYRRNLSKGKSYMDDMKYTEAAAMFRIALQYKPNDVQAQALLSRAQELAGKMPKKP